MTQAIEKPTSTPSLYQIALDSQLVDGEMAIAFGLASSEDPEEQARAEELISSLLQRASGNSALLKQKANAICHVHESLLGKAAHLRQIAADRLAKAEAEEKAAERLLKYLTYCLSALNPGQSKFELPEYTVASRKSEAVAFHDEDRLPDQYKQVEIKLKIPAGNAELAASTIEALHASGQAPDVRSTPDKARIKADLKALIEVPGAHLKRRTSWSIK